MAWPSTGSFTAWSGRVKGTVDVAYVAEAIGYVPIFLSNLPAAFWLAVDAAGADIRVTEADGETEIAAYVVSIDTIGETGLVIIESSGLSTVVDTDYYIYAGNPLASTPAVTDPNGRNAVFASQAGVWSLTGASALIDLTGNGFNLTATNSPTAGASGPYEGLESYTFNGTNQYLVHNGSVLSGLPASIITFTYNTSNTKESSAALLGVSTTAHGMGSYVRYNLSPNKLFATFANGASGASAPNFVSGTINAWEVCEHSRTTAISGTTRVWKDGTSATNTTNTGTIAFDRFGIGAMVRSTVALYFEGSISFTSVSASVPTIDYLTTYRSAWTEPAFWFFDAWETGGFDSVGAASMFFALLGE
jgi:hypothetical protein